MFAVLQESRKKTSQLPPTQLSLWSVRSKGPYTIFEVDSSIRSEVTSGPKISKLGHVTHATPT